MKICSEIVETKGSFFTYYFEISRYDEAVVNIYKKYMSF